MQIRVEAKSKYGVLADGKWFNPSEPTMLGAFVVGNTYDIEMADVKGKDGKTRSQITKMKLVAENSKPAVTAVVERPKAAARQSQQFDASRDERILVQGITQAVLQSQLLLDLKQLETVVVEVVAMVKRLSATK